MKRADVKAGVLYAVKVGNPVMVVDTAPWAGDWNRTSKTTECRPAHPGEKAGRGGHGYGSTTIGLPAMERGPLMMLNPDYRGGAGGFRMIPDPDPLRWEWKPTILEPRDALAPLDEHEAAQRDEQERQNAEREAQQREFDARKARVAAIADILHLDSTQRQTLLRRPGINPRGIWAEVTLEWLEEVADRLRQGSGCVEVR
jgi:hypothetical protein